MRYAGMLSTAVLVGFAGFMAWSGIVVGRRAFDSHRDSTPGTYLFAGAIYLFVACICVALALFIVGRLRRRV